MTLLRSPRLRVVLAILGAFALIATVAVTLLGPPRRPGEEAGPANAPPVDALGTAPQGIEYTDLGQQCTATECFRPVAVGADGLDAEEAIEIVYTHLIDKGWGRLLPEGQSDPDQVPYSQSALSDGAVLVQASTQPYTEEATAGLVLAHTVPPSPAS